MQPAAASPGVALPTLSFGGALFIASKARSADRHGGVCAIAQDDKLLQFVKTMPSHGDLREQYDDQFSSNAESRIEMLQQAEG